MHKYYGYLAGTQKHCNSRARCGCAVSHRAVVSRDVGRQTCAHIQWQINAASRKCDAMRCDAHELIRFEGHADDGLLARRHKTSARVCDVIMHARAFVLCCVLCCAYIILKDQTDTQLKCML